MTVRKVDYSPDELIAGVAGEMTGDQFAIYWMLCTLIYSKRRPVPDEETREKLKMLFRNMHRRTVDACLEHLIAASKVELIVGPNGAELMVSRCRNELERASNRVRNAAENGSKGGRPRSETLLKIDRNESETECLSGEINEIEKPDGFPVEKLSPSPSSPPSSPPSIKESPLPPKRGKVLSAAQMKEFDVWYEIFPLHKGRGAAEKAWLTARTIATVEQLIAGAQRYRAECAGRELRYVAHPATWLNQKRWLDEPTPTLFNGAAKAPAKSPPAIGSPEDIARRRAAGITV